MTKNLNASETLKHNRSGLGSSLAGLFFLLAAAPVDAQQINGVPGSPSATRTINGTCLPSQRPPFGGVINFDAKDSKPYWPPRVVPPKDAPNILLIMTDDVGFGAPRTFGGVIPTPNLDRIAGGCATSSFTLPVCLRQPGRL